MLLNQLADEFAARQRAGERPRVEEYCDRHPDLADDIRSLFPALVELERAKADAGPELAVEPRTPRRSPTWATSACSARWGGAGWGSCTRPSRCRWAGGWRSSCCRPSVFRDPTKRRRFEREAKAAAKLHHTNIVPVHGFGEHDGTPYYVMQFIPGLGLDAVIDELGRASAGGRTPGPTRPPSRRAIGR